MDQNFKHDCQKLVEWMEEQEIDSDVLIEYNFHPQTNTEQDDFIFKHLKDTTNELSNEYKEFAALKKRQTNQDCKFIQPQCF